MATKNGDSRTPPAKPSLKPPAILLQRRVGKNCSRAPSIIPVQIPAAPKLARSQSLRDKKPTFSIEALVNAQAEKMVFSRKNINDTIKNESNAKVNCAGDCSDRAVPSNLMPAAAPNLPPGKRLQRANTFKTRPTTAATDPSIETILEEASVPTTASTGPANTDKPGTIPPGPRTSTPIKSFKSTLADIKVRHPELFHNSGLYLSRNISQEISALEDAIEQNLKALPSVQYLNSHGFYYPNPNWSWKVSYRHFKIKAAGEKICEEGRLSMYTEFLNTVTTACSQIQSIRKDFREGLEDRQGFKMELLGSQMNLPRAGSRGRNCVTAVTVPYLQDLFKGMIAGQRKYSKWVSKVLTNPEEVKKREKIVEWCMRIGKRVKYEVDTIHLAVFYVDTFLTLNKIQNRTWGLLAVTALHIAGKMEEPEALSLDRLLRMCADTYFPEQVAWMEKQILEQFKFDVYPPLATVIASMVIIGGSTTFPSIHFKKMTLDLTLAILHRSLTNHQFVSIPPMDKAQAAMEVAVEFLQYQHHIFVQRDMSYHSIFPCIDPGEGVGQYSVQMCMETFTNRFIPRKQPEVHNPVKLGTAPVSNIKV